MGLSVPASVALRIEACTSGRSRRHDFRLRLLRWGFCRYFRLSKTSISVRFRVKPILASSSRLRSFYYILSRFRFLRPRAGRLARSEAEAYGLFFMASSVASVFAVDLSSLQLPLLRIRRSFLRWVRVFLLGGPLVRLLQAHLLFRFSLRLLSCSRRKVLRLLRRIRHGRGSFQLSRLLPSPIRVLGRILRPATWSWACRLPMRRFLLPRRILLPKKGLSRSTHEL